MFELFYAFRFQQAMNESLQVSGFEDWTYTVENVDGALQVRHHNIKLPGQE